MRGIGRVLGAATMLLGTPVICSAAPAHKSVKDCNAELTEHAADIAKAGESPASFFHACWTRSTPGQSTPIEATATVAPNRAGSDTLVRRTRAAAAPKPDRRIRYRGTSDADQVDEAPRRRGRPEPGGRSYDAILPPGAPPVSQPAPLPPAIADAADTLGRALRAAGLPPIQVPVVVPGTLDVVPVTLAPR